MEMSQLPLFLFGFIRQPVREASILMNDMWIALAVGIALVAVLSYVFKEQKIVPFLACAVAVALLLGAGFKAFLQEERPCVYAPGKIPCPLDFSLPSIHALIAFTVAIVALGSQSFPFYLSFALFVAFSRVYLGVHTITEVSAGLALAFFACVLAELMWRKAGRAIPEGIRIVHDARGIAR
jgi:membrane-associated phospholipid phosphatase